MSLFLPARRARERAPLAAPHPVALLAIVLACASLGELALFRVDWRPLIESKNDLRSMIVAAEALLSHRPLYDATNLCIGCYPSPFTYLPGSVLPFAPLAGMDPYLAFAIFTGLSAALFAGGVAALLVRELGARPALALALGAGGLLLFPSIDNVLWGQSQLALVGLVALGLALPPVAGGILIGVASYYKLYPALLLGALLLSGDRRRAAAGLATALGIGLAGLALFGLETHRAFLAFLPRLADFFNGPSHALANYSVRNHLGIHGAPDALVRAVALLTPCAWALGAWRLRRSGALCRAWTLGAMLLISPIVWRSYFLMALPIGILLYPHIRGRSGAWQWIYVTCLALALTAGLNMFVPPLAAAPPLPTIGIAGLCGLCLAVGRAEARDEGATRALDGAMEPER